MSARAVLAACLTVPAAASADGVYLRGGGQVRGEVVSSLRSPEVTVRTLSGLSLTLDRDEIEAVRRRSALKEEYVTRDRRAADTVDARLALAAWCERNLLGDERLEQMARVAAIDPDNEAANRALGRELVAGRWVDPDAAREAEGKVLVGDEWVSPLEASFLEQEAGEEAERRAWWPVVRTIERQLESGDPAEVAVAVDSLRRIDDPHAAEALVTRLGSVPAAAVRMEVVEALGRMADAAAVRPLVRFAAYDGEAAVRQRAIDGVPPALHRAAAGQFALLLRSPDNRVVNRAGVGLGAVGTVDDVPALIAGLTTSHKTTVRVLNDAPSYTVGGRDGIGMTRDPLSAEAWRDIQQASFPFGANVILPDSAYRLKTITVAVQNGDVRAALVSVTGQDFGFDESAWRRWYRREGKLAG